MTEKLCDYEIDMLRMLNGEDIPGMTWGAAMGAAVEFLHGGGYVRRAITGKGIEYLITEKGKAAISSVRT